MIQQKKIQIVEFKLTAFSGSPSWNTNHWWFRTTKSNYFIKPHKSPTRY